MGGDHGNGVEERPRRALEADRVHGRLLSLADDPVGHPDRGRLPVPQGPHLLAAARTAAEGGVTSKLRTSFNDFVDFKSLLIPIATGV